MADAWMTTRGLMRAAATASLTAAPACTRLPRMRAFLRRVQRPRARLSPARLMMARAPSASFSQPADVRPSHDAADKARGSGNDDTAGVHLGQEVGGPASSRFGALFPQEGQDLLDARHLGDLVDGDEGHPAAPVDDEVGPLGEAVLLAEEAHGVGHGAVRPEVAEKPGLLD